MARGREIARYVTPTIGSRLASIAYALYHNMSIVSPELPEHEPESLSGAKTFFHLCEQELLDLAAVCQIASPQSDSRALATLTQLASSHDAELVANEKTRAALLDAEIAFSEEDLGRRLALLPRLKGDYDFRRNLRAERAAVAAELARLEIELLSRGQQAEQAGLQQELAEVRSAEDAIVEKRADDLDPTTSTATSDDARRRQIESLERRRHELIESEARTFAREEKLRQLLITRTVAGFLLWLGYASVVATGSVLALIMSGASTFEFRPIIGGIRAVSISIFPRWPQWIRIVLLLGLLVLAFRLIVAAFVWCDNLLRKRWNWHEERVRPDATAQMSPQALTTRTYARFVALLPFAFVVASLVTLASGSTAETGTEPTGSSAEATLLTSLFPSVGYSFIGIAIAFLTTAVFMMYFIKIIQPRADGISTFRQSWEFAVPPLLLLLAVALTPLQDNISLTRWIPWVAFMLASSLVLAPGLVFHGVFKDARRAHDRIARLDRKLNRLQNLPVEEEEEAISATAAPLAQQRRLLERLLSKLPSRLIRRAETVTTVESPRLATTPEAASTTTPTQTAAPIAAVYRAIDYLVGSDLIIKIEEKRAEQVRISADLLTADEAIRNLESVLSFSAIDEVSRRLHYLRGIRNALPSNQEERRQHARIAKEALALKITATELAAKSIDPLLASVRDMLIKANPATGESPT